MPSLIQAKAIPEIMNNRKQNFIFQAMNGSGKTGAYAVPAIMVIDRSVSEIQVLIMASTRELIRQIMQVIEAMVVGTGIKVAFGDKDKKGIP